MVGMKDFGFYFCLYAAWLAVPITAFVVFRRLKIYLRILIVVVMALAWLYILGELLVDRLPHHTVAQS